MQLCEEEEARFRRGPVRRHIRNERMTISSGGGFGGGGSGSGGGFNSSSSDHGRSTGGTFNFGGGGAGGSGGDYNHHYGPNYHRDVYYGTTMYSSVPVYAEERIPGLRVRYDRKTELLNQNKACFTFVIIACAIVTYGVVYNVYDSSNLELDVNSSRLVTVYPWLVKEIQFRNIGETKGPILYEFNKEPHLRSEVRWTDFQNFSMNYRHQEYYYFLNKGSTVNMVYNAKIPNQHVIYFMVVRGKEELGAFLDRPDGPASMHLTGYGEFKYEARTTDDHIFAFANIHTVDAQVAYDMDIHSRKYDVGGASEKCNLKEYCKLPLPLFGSKFGVIETPGVGEMPVDNWEIEVTYGTRWITISFLFGVLILAYFAVKYQILRSYRDRPTVEHTPQVVEGSSPTAPYLPVSTVEAVNEEKHTNSEGSSNDHCCSVCLDAPKDCLFLPCGHLTTCFDCGLKLSKSHPPICPICRQPIAEVKKIFDT